MDVYRHKINNIERSILPPLRRAPLFNFEVPRCRIIAEITAEILFVAVPKMKVSDLIDILVGGVGNIDQLPVGEVGKKVPISLPPLLCSGSYLGWHRAVMKMRRSCACVVVCDLGNKNDNSTVSITNTGCIRCDNRCTEQIDEVFLFSIPSLSA